MFFGFSRAWVPLLSHRDTETVSEAYYEVHMTRVLHTARIRNVGSVMFAKRIIEMVSFEMFFIGIRRSEVRLFMGTRIFSLSYACDKSKNILRHSKYVVL